MPVVLALIAAAPVTVGQLALLRSHRRTTAAAEEAATIVRGNGRGTVEKMLRDVQDCQERQNVKLDSLLKWQVDHENAHTLSSN